MTHGINKLSSTIVVPEQITAARQYTDRTRRREYQLKVSVNNYKFEKRAGAGTKILQQSLKIQLSLPVKNVSLNAVLVRVVFSLSKQ